MEVRGINKKKVRKCKQRLDLETVDVDVGWQI